MIAVTAGDTNTVNGLVNVLTGTETIIVNGIVGSIFSKLGANSTARTIMNASYKIAGVKATRYIYRLIEWTFENGYVSEDWV